MLHLYGICILLMTLLNWKRFSEKLHAGYVAADGILIPVTGPNLPPLAYRI